MKGCRDYINEATGWHDANRSGIRPVRLVIVIVVLLILAVAVLFIWPKMQNSGFSVATANPHVPPTTEDATEASSEANRSTSAVLPSDNTQTTSAAEEIITIYITGAVSSPGVFDLGVNSRLNDAITAAGGLTELAAANYVNLAAKLEDGSHIHIPSNDEIASGEAARITDSGGGASLGETDANAPSADASKPVNINTANKEQLMTLSGIGEATAKKIIDYREKNGSFKTIEDLKNVSGIGDKKFEDLADQVCV